MHANRKSDFGFRRNIGEHDDDTRRPPRDTAEQQSRTRSGFSAAMSLSDAMEAFLTLGDSSARDEASTCTASGTGTELEEAIIHLDFQSKKPTKKKGKIEKRRRKAGSRQLVAISTWMKRTIPK